MAVVKANAYGHGAVACANRLASEGIEWFAVALPEEGIELRRAGIKERILTLGGFWPGQEELIIKHSLTPVIYHAETAEIYYNKALAMNAEPVIHIKVDTGMGRVGVRYDEWTSFLEKLKVLKTLRVEGIMTHFAAADMPSENDFTALQRERFCTAIAKARLSGFDPEIIDCANSPAAITKQDSVGNLIRPGGILYGLADDILPKGSKRPELKPVLELFSRIVHIKSVPAGESIGYGRSFVTKRKTQVASVPIGYADGYRRELSNRSRVLINGNFAPVVGRVSMDWILVDVTETTNPKVGDKVTLIGTDSQLRVSTEELAAAANTISYEITCGLGPRVGRYLKPLSE